MPAGPEKHVHVAILGAGVAGLWTARLLQAQGYNIALVSDQPLGAHQTIAAQGIIHGGTKYTLTRRLTGASEAISAMPGRWNHAMNDGQNVTLRATRRLADHCILWAATPIASRLKTFLSARVMSARVTPLPPGEQPRIIQRHARPATCYRLAEVVIDVPSLVEDLAAPLARSALLARPDYELSLPRPAQNKPFFTLNLRPAARSDNSQITLRATAVIALAGSGNENLLRLLGLDQAVQTQRRPLHMVLVKGPLPEPIFGHCIGSATTPRLTVTSHQWDSDRTQRIWYLGGELAESGVNRSRDEQIDVTRRELADIFPTLDQSRLQCDTFRIDRAEPRRPRGARPDEPVIVNHDGALVAWPTKLAFAPLLADRLAQALRNAGITPTARTQNDTPPFDQQNDPIPIAQPPWKTNRQWTPLDPSAAPD